MYAHVYVYINLLSPVLIFNSDSVQTVVQVYYTIFINFHCVIFINVAFVYYGYIFYQYILIPIHYNLQYEHFLHV